MSGKEEHAEIEHGVDFWMNKWDFHDLNYLHETYGRIFICEDGRVAAWEDGEE